MNNVSTQLDLEGKPKKPYVIDSSSLINLIRWYPIELRTFKPVWSTLENLVKFDTLVSHYEVYREISRKDDDLYRWCERNRKMFNDEYDGEVLKNVQEKYDRKSWNKNFNSPEPWADPWIVVLAIKNGGIIITDENRGDDNKIPKIAQKFGISSIHSYEFIKLILR